VRLNLFSSARRIGWNPDDYDALENASSSVASSRCRFAPQDRTWMWAIGHKGHIRRAAHGYEPTREAAMAAFAKTWRRE